LNKQIKAAHNFRERLPFPELITVVERMIEFDWSVGRLKPVEVSLIIPPHVFADAFNLRESERKILSSNNNQKFVLPSEDYATLKKNAIKEAAPFINALTFDSFEEYEEARFKVNNLICLLLLSLF